MRVLWLSITASSIAMFAMLFSVRHVSHPQQGTETMAPVMCVVAVAVFAVGIVLPRQTLRMAVRLGRLRGPAAYATPFILGLALTEATALFGFVLGFLGFAAPFFVPLFVLAWIGFLLRFPMPNRPVGVLGPTYPPPEPGAGP